MFKELLAFIGYKIKEFITSRLFPLALLVLVLFAGALLLWERRREHPASELWVNRVKAAEEAKQNEEQATQSGK